MKYRVIPMQCGNDESYALVFYEQDDKVKVDVYDASTKEKLASLDSPFPVGGITEIRYVQSYDVLFFAQQDTYPCKFKRENDEETGGYKFSFENVEFLPEPVMEWNESSKHTIKLFAKHSMEQLESSNAGGILPIGSITSEREPAVASSAVCLLQKTGAVYEDGSVGYLVYLVFSRDWAQVFVKDKVWLFNNTLAVRLLSETDVTLVSWQDILGSSASSAKITNYDGYQVLSITTDKAVVTKVSGDTCTASVGTVRVRGFKYSSVDIPVSNNTGKTVVIYKNDNDKLVAIRAPTLHPTYDAATSATRKLTLHFYGAKWFEDNTTLAVKEAFTKAERVFDIGAVKLKFSFCVAGRVTSKEAVKIGSIIDGSGNDVSYLWSLEDPVVVSGNTMWTAVGYSFSAALLDVEPLLVKATILLRDCDYLRGHDEAKFVTWPMLLYAEPGGAFYETMPGGQTSSTSDLSVSRTRNRVGGKGFRAYITVDARANSDSLVFGQTLAIRDGSQFYASGTFAASNNVNQTSENVLYNPKPPVSTEFYTDATYEQEKSALAASDLYAFRGSVTVKTDGVWSGIVELQEVDDNDNVTTVASISSEMGLSNTELERDITDFGRRIRVACKRREKATEWTTTINGDGTLRVAKNSHIDTGCMWSMRGNSSSAVYLRIIGKAKVYGVVDCYEVEVVGSASGAFATRSYALGAWSTKNGYPRHITIFQERLVYAGNKEKPMTVWMSKTNKWKDFELGTDATSAITATLATEKYDSIEWLTLNKNSILLGSKYNEFSIGANDGTVTTADNILASTMSSIGGAPIPAAKVGTATLMVKVGQEEIHKVDYNALSEQSTGTQVSMLARHLFEGDRIMDIFSTQSPRNMLFCVHESGKLSSLTYEQEYDVLGFARHDVLDGVESGCVIRRGGRDVLCMVVREGDSYVLGEIDFDSDVWTDDGKDYESEVLTTPLKPPTTKTMSTGYGRQTNIAGADVYVSSDSRQFRARMVGSDWVRVDNGFGTDGELRGWDTQRVELPTTGSWVEEPMVEIVCDTAHPLTVYGVGAAIAQGN